MSELPAYITQYNFNQESLKETLTSGTLTNNFDSYGNLILKSSEDALKQAPADVENYLVLMVPSKRGYDLAKLESFRDLEFSEFTDIADKATDSVEEFEAAEVITEVENQLMQENILQTQIDELSDILEQETDKNIKEQEDSETNYRAAKALIIQQRIVAGEGATESDFSDAFPFLPLTAAQLAAGETGVENSPFMRTPRTGGYT